MTFLRTFDFSTIGISDQKVRRGAGRRKRDYLRLFEAANKGDIKAQESLKERFSIKIWSKEEIERTYPDE